MKLLFALFAIIPQFAFSQKTTLFKTTKDKFTDEITKELIEPIVLRHGSTGKCYVSLSMDDKGVSSFAITIKDKDFGCVQENFASVYFLSSDGTKYKAYNSVHDCDGIVILLLKGGPYVNENFPAYLNANLITAIRIENDHGRYDIDVSKFESMKIKAAANELYNFSARPLDPNAPVPKKAKIPNVGRDSTRPSF